MALRWDSEINDWVDDDSGVVGTPADFPTQGNPNVPDNPTGGNPYGSGYYGDPTIPPTPPPPDPTTPPPGPAPTTTTPPPTTPPPIGGGRGGGSILSPFGGKFQPGTLGQWTLPDLPAFTAPDLPTLQPLNDTFSYKDYTPTTWADVTADPTYAARRNEGIGALENSAAGGGLLRSGGTLHDLVNYAEDFAGRDFANVDARRMAAQQLGYGEAAGTFDRNVGVKQASNQSLLDLYDRSLSGKQAEFAPKLVGYQTDAQKRQSDAQLAYSRAWDQYMDEENQYYKNADLRLRSAALV